MERLALGCSHIIIASELTALFVKELSNRITKATQTFVVPTNSIEVCCVFLLAQLFCYN